MNNIQNKETFSTENYTSSFQPKIFTLLLHNKEYLEQMQEILLEEYFDTDASKWFLSMIKAYFKEYKNVPTPDVIYKKVLDIQNEVLRESVKDLIKKEESFIDAEDLEFVKKESLEFCFNQNLKNAILESADDLQKKDYESIKKKIDNAMKLGSDRNIGHKYNVELDTRMSDASRICVSTPWDVINDITDGGAAAGDLFVIVAPPGIGKTWGLVNIGTTAIKTGLCVIHYSMELNEHYVGRRYDAYVSGISAQSLKYNKETIERAISAIEGKLLIKYFPPKAATVNTLRAHIDKCILQGYKPDMIIVDYADLLRSTLSSNRAEVRHTLENIYEDLRALAGEYHIPVWTASQANRSSLEHDVIGAEKIAEAFSKIMVADFVISLSRKIEDKVAGTGRWHVIKNRLGPDGITFPSKINTANGQIKIYEESSLPGKDVQKQMDKGNEYTRILLRKRHGDIYGNDESEDKNDKIRGFEEADPDIVGNNTDE